MGISMAVGRYMQDMMFPNQFTWSRDRPKSAATEEADKQESKASTSNIYELLLDMGPNHGQAIADTALKTIWTDSTLSCLKICITHKS